VSGAATPIIALMRQVADTPGWSVREVNHGYLAYPPGGQGGISVSTRARNGHQLDNILSQLRRAGWTEPARGKTARSLRAVPANPADSPEETVTAAPLTPVPDPSAEEVIAREAVGAHGVEALLLGTGATVYGCRDCPDVRVPDLDAAGHHRQQRHPRPRPLPAGPAPTHLRPTTFPPPPPPAAPTPAPTPAAAAAPEPEAAAIAGNVTEAIRLLWSAQQALSDLAAEPGRVAALEAKVLALEADLIRQREATGRETRRADGLEARINAMLRAGRGE
jgi:hypothetical protein